jgi:hypothetical protein
VRRTATLTEDTIERLSVLPVYRTLNVNPTNKGFGKMKDTSTGHEVTEGSIRGLPGYDATFNNVSPYSG